VPAHRSRTERWRECLQQIYERGGGIEFSIARTLPYEPPVEGKCLLAPSVAETAEEAECRVAPDLMWRVRVIGLSETEILVDRPAAMGSIINVGEGTDIVAVISVGQNRWMFHSRLLGQKEGSSPWGGSPAGLRMAMPEKVERCHRRDFLRISTAELTLPTVECWPLLNPATVAAAEAANRGMIHDLESGRRVGAAALSSNLDSQSILLPEVGPTFNAHLLNIGGGGVGLVFEPSEVTAAERARYVWLRLNLQPIIPAPLAMTAKLVHKHLDSSHSMIAGAAFEFSFNPAHRDFVVEQIGRFVSRVYGKARAA